MTEALEAGTLETLRSEFWRAVHDMVPEAFEDLASLDEDRPMRTLAKLHLPDVRFQAWYGEMPQPVPREPNRGETKEEFESRRDQLNAEWDEFFAVDRFKSTSASERRTELEAEYKQSLEEWGARQNLGKEWCSKRADRNLRYWLRAYLWRDPNDDSKSLAYIYKSRHVYAPTAHKDIPVDPPGIWESTDQAVDRIRNERGVVDAECGRNPELDRFIVRPGEVTTDTRRNLEMLARYQVGGDGSHILSNRFNHSTKTIMKRVKKWAKILDLTLREPSKN